MFQLTLYQVAKLFLFLLIGFVLSKTHSLPEKAEFVLSRVVINCFLPCVMFTTFCSQFTVSTFRTEWRMMLASLILSAAELAVCTPLGRRMTSDRYAQNVCVYSLAIPNTGFVGIPIIMGLFGSAAVMRMQIFAIPLLIYTYTEGARLLLDQQKLSLRGFLNAPFIGMLLGMVFGMLRIPVFPLVNEVLSGCAACMSPCAMLLTGCTIASYRIRDILADPLIYRIVPIRMIVLPVLILLVCRLIGLSDDTVMLACSVFAMPTGLNTVVYPASIGRDSRLGAGMACISNTLALLTVPLLFHFFVV